MFYRFDSSYLKCICFSLSDLFTLPPQSALFFVAYYSQWLLYLLFPSHCCLATSVGVSASLGAVVRRCCEGDRGKGCIIYRAAPQRSGIPWVENPWATPREALARPGWVEKMLWSATASLWSTYRLESMGVASTSVSQGTLELRWAQCWWTQVPSESLLHLEQVHLIESISRNQACCWGVICGNELSRRQVSSLG